MCKQAYEILMLNGRIRGVEARPLNQYFELMEMQNPFIATHTANHRGYIASWEVLEGKLYLKHLRGKSNFKKSLKVEDLFPNQKTVMAAWFTGSIKTWENHNQNNKGKKDWHYHEMIFQLGQLVEDRIITPPTKKSFYKSEFPRLKY